MNKNEHRINRKNHNLIQVNQSIVVLVIITNKIEIRD